MERIADKSLLRKGLALFVVILLLQLLPIQFVWEEKYESRVAIQIQEPTHLNRAKIICNAATIRGFLEEESIAHKLGEKYSLPENRGHTRKPLIPRHRQVYLPTSKIFGFRYRHKSPLIAYQVVTDLLQHLSDRWQETVKMRFERMIHADSGLLKISIDQLEQMLMQIPQQMTITAHPTEFGIAIPTYSLELPHVEYESILYRKHLQEQRQGELYRILKEGTVASFTIPRWVVVQRPEKAVLPVWPSRFHLSILAFINAIFFSLIWYFWSRFGKRNNV